MTDLKILTEAINKARSKGYKKDNSKLYLVARGSLKSTLSLDFYRGLIFDHDFAKAFWGEEKDFCARCSPHIISKSNQLNYYKTAPQCDNCWDWLIYRWQYHLQQMILEKEPLKYLEKFL